LNRGILRAFAFLIATSLPYNAFSQAYRVGISPCYNIPIGELAWSYSPAIGAKLHFSWLNQNNHGITRATGVMIGYHAFQPLADTLYYIADQGGLGTTGNGADIGKAVFSPFKMLHLAATMDWGIPLSKRLSINPGLHVGMLYAQRSIAFQDNGGEDGIDELVTWATLNGQAGLEYKLGAHLSANFFVAYTFIIQLGNTNPDAMDYNENTGMFYHFYSPGISLNYYF
jgi:hypothetical protein